MNTFLDCSLDGTTTILPGRSIVISSVPAIRKAATKDDDDDNDSNNSHRHQLNDKSSTTRWISFALTDEIPEDDIRKVLNHQIVHLGWGRRKQLDVMDKDDEEEEEKEKNKEIPMKSLPFDVTDNTRRTPFSTLQNHQNDINKINNNNNNKNKQIPSISFLLSACYAIHAHLHLFHEDPSESTPKLSSLSSYLPLQSSVHQQDQDCCTTDTEAPGNCSSSMINMAAHVYCTNGKTRSGIVIACYLKYTGLVSTTFQGFEYFVQKAFARNTSSTTSPSGNTTTRGNTLSIPPSLHVLFQQFDQVLDYSMNPISITSLLSEGICNKKSNHKSKENYFQRMQGRCLRLKTIGLEGIPVEDMPCLEVWDIAMIETKKSLESSLSPSSSSALSFPRLLYTTHTNTSTSTSGPVDNSMLWEDGDGLYFVEDNNIRIKKDHIYCLICRFGQKHDHHQPKTSKASQYSPSSDPSTILFQCTLSMNILDSYDECKTTNDTLPDHQSTSTSAITTKEFTSDRVHLSKRYTRHLDTPDFLLSIEWEYEADNELGMYSDVSPVAKENVDYHSSEHLTQKQQQQQQQQKKNNILSAVYGPSTPSSRCLGWHIIAEYHVMAKSQGIPDCLEMLKGRINNEQAALDTISILKNVLLDVNNVPAGNTKLYEALQRLFGLEHVSQPLSVSVLSNNDAPVNKGIVTPESIGNKVETGVFPCRPSSKDDSQNNPVDDGLPLRQDPEYVKYFKMIKCGLPLGAVKNAMVRDGKDPSILDLDLNQSLKFQISVEDGKGEKQEIDTGIPLKEDPDFQKYFRMLRMGLPKGAVINALKREGKDPFILDMNPDKSLVYQTLNVDQKTTTTSTKKKENEKLRRKKIFWSTIDPNKVPKNSLWNMVQGSCTMGKLHYDEREFDALFTESTTSKNKTVTNEGSHLTQKKKKKKKLVQVIDAKRSMNGGIILAKLKLCLNSVAKCVDRMDHGKFDSMQLQALKDFLPTPEERRDLIFYMKDGKHSSARWQSLFSECSETEKYMVTMLEVHNADIKLDAMYFQTNFQSRFDSAIKDIRTLERACDEVRASKRFRKLMALILTVVNHINTGGEHGKMAMGFTLGALLKLNEAKAFDKKTSVLQYVAKLVKSNDPTVLLLDQDLPTISLAESVVLEKISGEIQRLQTELIPILENVRKETYRLELLDSDGKGNIQTNPWHNEDNSERTESKRLGGRTDMEIFCLESMAACKNLAISSIDPVRQKYYNLLEYFGEDDHMMTAEFFGILKKFLVEWKFAIREIESQDFKESRKMKNIGQKGNVIENSLKNVVPTMTTSTTKEKIEGRSTKIHNTLPPKNPFLTQPHNTMAELAAAAAATRRKQESSSPSISSSLEPPKII